MALPSPQFQTANAVSFTGNGSALTTTATGSTIARSQAARGADRLNARDYGATGDGTTSDGAALTACGAAAAAAGKDVYVPAGTYYVYNTSTATSFIFAPGVTYYFDRRAVILCDSTANAAPVCHNNGVAGDYTLIGGTFKGQADTAPVTRGHNVAIFSAGIVRLEGVSCRYSNYFGFALTANAKVSVVNCSVYRTVRDGIAVWNTPDVLVTGCDIEGVIDDAISCHTNDTDVNPRTVVLITGNRIRESQGINVLGAKMATISGNIFRFCFGAAIEIGASGGFGQGDTTNFGVKITNNQIFDQCAWPNPTPRSVNAYGIVMVFPNRGAGGAASAPGDPAPTTGTPSPLLGAANTPGALYTQNLTGPQPGSYWIDVSNNTIVRTRPAVTSISQWNGNASIWLGENASGATYSGAVTDANLGPTGILVIGSMRDGRIAHNIIRTTGSAGISFNGPGNNGNYDGVEITGNKISDYSQAAVVFTFGGTSHKMRIIGNVFDADPGFRHSNRGTGGTWVADNYPHGVAPSLDGVSIENNHFRNLNRPVTDTTVKALVAGNTYFGSVTAFGVFSAANVGIGFAPNQDMGWQYAPEDADPRSASYGVATATPVPAVLARSGGTISGGLGVFNHAAPGTQPAAPVTLNDVILVLRGAGLCA